MEFKNIILEKKAKIATITLNRPEKLNALSEDLLSEFDSALENVNKDQTTSVLIVKGAGRAFSAGYDIGPSKAEVRQTATVVSDMQRMHETARRWLKIWDMRKPVIAQIQGYCIAGASHLVSMCDISIAAEDARIAFVTVGGPVGAALGAAEVCHLIGPKKAKEIFFNMGKLIDGKEAEKIGFVNKAVPADKLEDEVNTLAREISEVPLDLLSLNKAAINRYVEMTGLKVGALYGADMCTISHYAPSPQKFMEMILEKGLEEALKNWRKEIQ